MSQRSRACFVSPSRFRHNQEMAPPPLVSVIIDSYNYGHFIEEAIDSILSQDFPAEQMELLVIDDGSTDDTAERVRKYGDRVKYLYKPNGGQASAFNVGFLHARGEIVALLDADDYYLPGKLKRVVSEFAQHPDAGMVYHRLQEYHTRTGKRVDGYFTPISGKVAASRDALLSYVLYPTSALAFRRLAIAPLLPIPERLTIQADSHLTGLIIFLAPIVAVAESLAVYRMHDTNLFHSASLVRDVDRTLRRIATREILVDDMKAWLVASGRDLSHPDLHALFMQWRLTQEGDEFQLDSPGRLRLFRHLWQYNTYFRPRLTPRHLAVNYAQAFASLLLGYDHLDQFDVWLRRAQRLVRPGRSPKV
jgi:glycosyltransferase involved in cell wall biosynthesis